MEPRPSVYLDLFCIRQANPKGAAYREEGTRLFAMSSNATHGTDGFAEHQEAFNPTQPISEIQGVTFVNKGTHSVFTACENAFRIEI